MARSGGSVIGACERCGTKTRSYPYKPKRYCGRSCSNAAKLGTPLKHGESGTRLHGIWCHMKTRCLCQTSNAYPYYGGRGISVCQEWQDSFETFRDWALVNGYEDHLELDRRDTNGNYEPENCRWATRVQQMRNTRKRRDAKTSQFKGVSRHSQNGNWVVQLHADGKPIHVGVFSDEIEAAKAYDAAARKRYGEFAHLNFPA